jgi:single-stranded-DNA-specific exonuclease
MTSFRAVHQSILGQHWRWRGRDSEVDEAGADASFVADDMVARLLLSRGIPREGLDRHRAPTIRDFMPDPSIFRDMDRAAVRLADAVASGEAVTVFGDYDVDGATSAALLIRLLRDLGLSPQAYIPDRLMEGYGPSGEALGRIAAGGAKLVVTVDCGAQAFDALEHAASAGLDVIVVDHHKCAATLPRALAVVNPNRLDEELGAAHGHLAAVGVAFLLGAALLRELRSRHFFAQRPEPRLIDLLDLVALGTVADVAQLCGVNRAFVAQGLKVMALGRNLGLAALARKAGLTKPASCTDLGFALGPRINAGGRVGRADLGVRLLITEDPAEAAAISAELDRLNAERRAIEAEVGEGAMELARSQPDRSVTIVAARGWHPGVIGIVAGRLKERLGRPAIVIALDEQGVGKGSGRSIAGVDLGAAVLAAKDMGLLVAGGGHAMAAGLTVAADRIDALAEFLDERLQADVARARGDRALLIDAAVSCGGVIPTLVEALDAAGPFGAGWPGPRIVAGPVRVIRADIVGSGHVRAIVAGDDGRSIKAMAFRQADSLLGQALLGSGTMRRLWLAGRARIDDWSGGGHAELHVDDAAWAD